MKDSEVLVIGWITLAWGFTVLYLITNSLARNCYQNRFEKQNKERKSQHE